MGIKIFRGLDLLNLELRVNEFLVSHDYVDSKVTVDPAQPGFRGEVVIMVVYKEGQ